MRHQRTGKKLGRDPAHRKALYANLAGALIEHGRIKTTVTKAKAVKPIAEQMITLGRRGDIHARRQAVAFLRSKDVVHKLFSEVGPAYATRPGGYTRIVRIGPRQGDASEMAYLELVDTPLTFKTRERAESEEGKATTDAEPVDESTQLEASGEAEAIEPETDVQDPEPEASVEDAVPESSVEVPEPAADDAEQSASEGAGAERPDA